MLPLPKTSSTSAGGNGYYARRRAAAAIVASPAPPPPPVFEDSSSKRFGLRELSQLAYSFGQLGHRPGPGWWAAFLSVCSTRMKQTTVHLAVPMSSAALSRQPAWSAVAKVGGNEGGRSIDVDAGKAQQISVSSSIEGIRGSSSSRTAGGSSGSRSTSNFNAVSITPAHQSYANLLHGISCMGPQHPPSQWMLEFWRCTLPLLPGMSAAELHQVASAIGRMAEADSGQQAKRPPQQSLPSPSTQKQQEQQQQHKLHPPTTTQQRKQQLQHDLQPEGGVSASSLIPELGTGTRPPPPWLDTFCRAVKVAASQWRLRDSSCVAVLWALAALRHNPGD